ncbi:hypothetical protein DL764_007609 [Monosporascus ibericus]|uniref:WSC domain-containing protein n=1 Tax=Monosporascus ibericus TaxID=155417 RepID=A0A4V1X9I0_9PEZI|nr:hypothetical protein DL764_007609 [Monosporascus ibericus]
MCISSWAVAATSLTGFSGALVTRNCTQVVPGEYLGTPFESHLEILNRSSEKAWFKIRDPTGQHVCESDLESDLSLLTFSYLNSSGQRPLYEKIKRLVIVAHGARRNSHDYHNQMLHALSLVDHPDINPDTVAVVSPYLPVDFDIGIGYPDPNDPQVASRALVRFFDRWLIQRYAAMTKSPEELGVDTPITYYVGNPNSLLWFDESRSMSTGNCSETWNYWREGLPNYMNYDVENSGEMIYKVELAQAGPKAILANYNSKSIAHGRATRDRSDFKEIYDCAVYTTGKDGSERFLEFLKRFPATSETMFESEAGRTRLFLDNWDGDGSRAFDFGYPRIQAGDDPHPDPALAGGPLAEVDYAVYAGGMTWRGCWSDVDEAQTVVTFPDEPLYRGNLLTRDYCAEVCAAAGFAIAGMNGSKCFCANALGYQAAPVVSTSCTLASPANASQTCGGPSRLMILAADGVELWDLLGSL